MSKFGNIFYWDTKNNERISLSELDDIKTNKIVRCRIKGDRINIEPLDETDSNFNENKVWKILDVIKDDYKKVDEFLVKFKESNDWSWHRFYKKLNGDIEMVFQEEDEDISSENDNKMPLGEPKDEENKGQGVGEPISAETSEINVLGNNKDISMNNDSDASKLLKKMEKQTFEKTKENNKLADKLDINRTELWIKTKFKFSKKDLENVPEIKTDISNTTEEEMKDWIESTSEGVDVDTINANIASDKKESEYKKVFTRKGMGKFYAIQSIINDGTLRSVNKTEDEIYKKLNELYQDNIKINDDYLANMCLIYKKFLEEWISNGGKNNVDGSAPYRNAMTSYFPEIISPFIFLYSDSTELYGHESINLLKQKIGNKNLLSANPFISYPQSPTQMLFDSILYFGDKSSEESALNDVFKCLRISVKGGRNGMGAKASINGLKSYFYEKENINLPDNFFTSKRRFFDASLYDEYYRPYIKKFALQEDNEIIIKILSLLMLSNVSSYKKIVKVICDSIGIKYKDEVEMFKNMQNYLNTNKKFEQCVIVALKYASYDFAQLNCIETPSGDGDFHYKYAIQYPALFEGTVNFELISGEKEHKLTFHIVGNNLPSNITQYD